MANSCRDAEAGGNGDPRLPYGTRAVDDQRRGMSLALMHPTRTTRDRARKRDAHARHTSTANGEPADRSSQSDLCD
jgi:hypothetical protein